MTITTITTTAASFAMPAAVVVAAAAALTLVARTWRTALVADVQAVIANHAMADSSLDNRGRGYVAEAQSAKKSPKSVKPAAPPRGLTT